SSDSDDTSTNPPDSAVDDTDTNPTPDPEGTEGQSDDTTDDRVEEPGTTTDGGGTGGGATGDLIENPPEKTWQDALEAAEAQFDGDVTKIELEEEDSGRREYKIELISSDQKFSIKFDADTLDELRSKTDDLGSEADEKRARVFDVDEIIDLDAAAQSDRDEVDGVIEEWKVEGKSNGSIEFEFDIVPPGATDDIEVEIDARTGDVLEVDD